MHRNRRNQNTNSWLQKFLEQFRNTRPTPSPQPTPSPLPPTSKPDPQTPLPSPPGPDDDKDIITARANAERASHGLAPLRRAVDIDQVAERWSAKMAAEGNMRHNPNLAKEVTGWRSLGENVAYNSRGAAAIHQAWIDSPGHHENIDRASYTEIGVGVVRDSRGTLWATQVFRG